MDGPYDLVIRGGTVVDGSGEERRTGDVAIKDGVIAAVGEVTGSGAEEISAAGLLVTPGFVDVHTHYDGQATWAERMQPSSWHGVTTVVMGNCGVGFAPCRAEDRDCLIQLMEGVEDIPNPVLTEGLPWNWRSFPEFLDALDGRSFDVDIGVQLGHAPVRVFVMGERGVNREPATETDIAEMAQIAQEAMTAGALGFSTSRTINHKSADGEQVPTYEAAEKELAGIAQGLKAADAGVLQLVCDFENPLGDFGMMQRLVESSSRPLSFSLLQKWQAPKDCEIVLDALEAAGKQGMPIRGQVPCRPVGLLYSLEGTSNPFRGNSVYSEVADLRLAEKVAQLERPEFRARLLAEHRRTGAARMMFPWTMCFLLADVNPDYEPTQDLSVAAVAQQRDADPAEVALDHLLANGGRGLIYVPIFNYAEGNLDVTRRMMASPYTIPGLSDGGAHMGIICDGSFPTTLLTHWTRDRSRGPRFTIEQVVRMQTHATAEALGLNDRGLIRPGLRADLNLIDIEKLKVHAPEFTYDLPAGGRRLVQRAEGYRYTIVAGQVTYRDGEPTGALPGRLVRGARTAPAAA